MTSWGTGPYGVGSFGVTTTLTVEYAFAINTHEVVVVLSKPPKNILPLLPGDVQNSLSWELSIPSSTTILEIAGIRPFNTPLEWAIRSLKRLPDSSTTVRIKATSLLDASGAIMGMPDFADFLGVTEVAISTPLNKAAAMGAGSRDFANLPVPSVEGASVSGTLTMKGGDYALMSGVELLKKLVLRRLTTAPRDFYHLPNYGVGVRVKEPIPAGDLVRLQSRIERELLRERDIGSVTVALTQSQNVLTIRARVRATKTGQDVTVGLFSPIGQS